MSTSRRLAIAVTAAAAIGLAIAYAVSGSSSSPGGAGEDEPANARGSAGSFGGGESGATGREGLADGGASPHVAVAELAEPEVPPFIPAPEWDLARVNRELAAARRRLEARERMVQLGRTQQEAMDDGEPAPRPALRDQLMERREAAVRRLAEARAEVAALEARAEELGR